VTGQAPRRPHRAQAIGHVPRRPHRDQATCHSPTAATRDQGDRPPPTAVTPGPAHRPRAHDGSTEPRGPATPSRRLHVHQRTATFPRRPHGAHWISHAPSAATRRPHGSQGTGHAPTAATRLPESRPRPYGGYTGPRETAARQRLRNKVQKIGRTPTTDTRTSGTDHAPRREHGAKGTGHAPTAATRDPGDRPRTHGSLTGIKNRPRPPGGHMVPRGHVVPPRRPHGAQESGRTPTTAIRGLEDRPRPTTATRGPGDRPRPHGGHTVPRGTAAPPRQTHRAQGTGRTHTLAIRGPGNRPHPHTGYTVPRGPATPHGGHKGPRVTAAPTRRPHKD